MLIDFLLHLRKSGLAVSTTEFLALLGAMRAHLAEFNVERFHLLARTCLIKDEALYDRFDRAFAAWMAGAEFAFAGWGEQLPEDWLRRQAELYLSDEDREALAQTANWDELMEQLRQRLAEQHERHEGGSRFIGTAGTSPFGAWGDHPAGVRIGQHQSRRRSAVKVWEQRQFRDLDDARELGTRDFKLALRRLRRFAREGAAEELDIDETIRATAKEGGLLNIRHRPERRNVVRLLLFLDVGGSMDPHVRLCEELFSAARAEFRHLEHYYFHNCVYERLWRSDRRRGALSIPTAEAIRTWRRDYRVVFVGDASMSPYELTHPGGSVEHWNEEPGVVWLERVLQAFPRAVWLNPLPADDWDYTRSVQIVRDLMGGRMYPLSLAGIDRAMRCLMTGQPADPAGLHRGVEPFSSAREDD
jgi:uncharacterized protein with von Willebrand factor type A (vWA) domain